MKDTTYVDEKGVNQYPYRFLSYEKIDIIMKLEEYADKVIMDFPDGLGSMTYMGKLGYSYSYRDDVGYTVSFPYEITQAKKIDIIGNVDDLIFIQSVRDKRNHVRIFTPQNTASGFYIMDKKRKNSTSFTLQEY